MNHRRTIKLTVLLLVMFLAASCALLPPEEPTFPVTVNLTSDREIGQSFIARRDGLNGIRLFITPIERWPESLIISLYDSPEAEAPLWQGTAEVPPGLSPGWFTLPIETQRDSAGAYYFVTVATESEQRIKLSTAPENYYPEGSFYRDRVPENRHLEFRLRYSLFWTAVGLLAESGPALGLMGAFSFLFTLPGWALFSAFWPRWEDQPVHNRWILASGLGLSVYPVLVLLSRLVRLESLPWQVWLVPVGAAASFAWRFWKGDWRPARPDFRLDIPAFIFFSLLVIVLATRLVPLRTLEVGMWGDSYHHTLITQLLIDNGGLFSSWEPYAPLITYTYHFGFHTAAALLSLLTDAPAHEAVLQMGQLVNFLAVAGLVPLADGLVARFRSEPSTRNQRLYTGAVILLTAGLLASVPMLNINWGRYTQLAGQAILVIWMACSLDHFREDKKSWKPDLVSWVLLAGLGLTHYRVLIFAVLWVPAYWLFGLRRGGIFRALVRVVRAGYGAVLLILPWFVIIYSGKLFSILQNQITTPPEELDQVIVSYNQVADLTAYLPIYLWAAVAVVTIWAVARRAKEALSIVVWFVLLVLLANPAWLGLPGTGIVNNFAVVLAVYIPAALLVGFGGSWLIAWVRSRFRLSFRNGLEWVPIGLILMLAVAGAGYQLSLVRPVAHALVTRSDLYAYSWMREHLPPGAVFHVNMYPAQGGITVAGSDGGWWIPYFTGNETTLPPYVMMSEITKPRDLRMNLLALQQQVAGADFSDPGILRTFEQLGITHVYIGQRNGAVGSQGDNMDPYMLNNSDFFRLIFHYDHVWIFEVQ